MSRWRADPLPALRLGFQRWWCGVNPRVHLNRNVEGYTPVENPAILTGTVSPDCIPGQRVCGESSILSILMYHTVEYDPFIKSQLASRN